MQRPYAQKLTHKEVNLNQYQRAAAVCERLKPYSYIAQITPAIYLKAHILLVFT